MLEDVREIYRNSRKAKDIFFNTYVARPIAAVLLSVVKDLGFTPNQWTFAALGLSVLAATTLCLWRTYTGLIVGAVLLEGSYILDCIDGQLARLKGQATPVGAHLDFLMDELKAFLYIAAITLRLWLVHEQTYYLWIGLLGLAAAAGGISLTTFMRRPEYVATAKPPPPPLPHAPPPRRTPIGIAVGAAEYVGKWIIHYPSYFLYLAIANYIEAFFFVYLAAHAAYLGRAVVQIVLRLGRSPAPGTAAALPPPPREDLPR